MKKITAVLPLLILLVACTDEPSIDSPRLKRDGSALISSIVSFAEVDEQGMDLPSTRVSIDGRKFEPGDLMRLRVIAPYGENEYGEDTWGGTYDNWRAYQWSSTNASSPARTGSWGSVSGYDMNCDFSPSSSYSDFWMPQATPYIFTATTWTEEIHHILPSSSSAGNVILSLSNIFKADQRREKDYKASDVLWAQSFVQTGTEYVTLSFQHKMAALKVDISDFATVLTTGGNAPEVVLTLEGMPDIDQQEVTIGNYYVEKMISKKQYGDWYRCKCAKEDNGKVLGIVVVDEEVTKGYKQVPFTDASIGQDATYIAYKNTDSEFLLIIPPYTVPAGITPTLWLRQGDKRWSAPLGINHFESGKRYNINFNRPTTQNGQI